ncbi:metal ion (Mn2+, iron) transporter Nramp family [Streptococcus infantarius subsp. infantarius]|uniref:Divalent metal cation transporter MntH n=1 Tax=Streptococcus infantarius TaxID=102684 RepID=A0A380KLF7_9STRE|nr:metal ion (Mn2+, iron) transporter Nramp family [Streptococcus infantarius subsp. infantarius]SUN67871.1 metal ion (Mn2+-iron) transporter (NRAMP) family protein [Streptococcus infantarius]MCO4490725.1 metal ion (Mn2+, iron) transporter Nramp family [Streptococcus infantarius subsp. infantarius]MCO4491838.1 metal ion (Mn2+, iron) transporter Nramp family [Streptococcus infantarius subsp. infantarius]MCO4508429.1 metal ion (Mn2+, iron) transporter Nramp family [Streptococcus infantarius subsp
METIVTSQKSLSEVNQSIAVPKNASFWQTLLSFIGPGALVAVGYMDPGNWITSVVGGATYKYLLLSVILISSLIAMQLQQMAGKLGIVTRKDLAQTTAAHLPKKLRILLFIVIELALMATDLAEVIGSGIALHLLFGWPLLFSILITILDVFILLSLMKLGFRKIEALVSTLIATILIIFLYLVLLSKPSFSGILHGYIPQPSIIDLHQSGVNIKLTLALGIIGATVMPHNLYLHSSISQTRKVDYSSQSSIKQAVRFMTWDSNIQLTVAFVVNSLLLILGASLFYGHANDINAFSQMYDALQDPNIAGAVASAALSTLFAIALLASGQNSTITGTLTGQIVMEGFLKLRLPQWLIRLVTRLVALAPVLIIALLYGSQESVLDQLIVYSQVFLSLALPFSIFPLVYFTSNRKIMGDFVNSKWNSILGYLVAIILTVLNLKLIIDLF